MAVHVKDRWLEQGRGFLTAEATAVQQAAQQLDAGFTEAVNILLEHPGKVVVSGVGKSGHVARKLAATLCSTGTPAVFLHPSEAVHGDLGIYTPGDPTIVFSRSGTTEELIRLTPLLKEFASPLIAIVGNTRSPLAQAADAVINAAVSAEADPNNLAPTSSTTVAMALGDALALTVMSAKRFTSEDFARFHPGGQLGRNLHLYVRDLMHPIDRVACVSADETVKEVTIAMTRYPLGAACVLENTDTLIGLITDGDLRRALMTHDDIRFLTADAIMTRTPITITSESRVKDAIEVMENRPQQISVLPVIGAGRFVGLIRIHDIYR